MGSHSRIPLNVPTPSIKEPGRPLRLGLVCFSRSFGGLEMTTVRLASLLARRGALPLLIVPESSPMHLEAIRLGLRTRTLEPRMKYGDIGAALGISRMFRSEDLDTALFFRSQDLHLGAVDSFFGGRTRLVFYQQMQSGIGKKDSFHSAIFSRLSAWYTLTDIMRNEVLRSTRMSPEKVHVAYLGRDGSVFDPARIGRAEARRSLGIPARAVVAGVLGRLDRQKGQVEFLRAFSEVKKKIPRALFLIAGDETKNDPGMKSELLRLADSLSVGEGIRILPPIDDVPRFMAALDLFAMPSYSETYGLVLLEAMAMGIPVLSTLSGGVPELVRHGKEGLLIEPRNVPQLSDTIIRLFTDRSMMRQMGRSGRKRFLQHFEESDCVDHLLDLLEDLPHLR